MTFASLVLIEFFKAYSFRSDRLSVAERPFANKWLNLAIVWELALLALVVNLPFLQDAFGTQASSRGMAARRRRRVHDRPGAGGREARPPARATRTCVTASKGVQPTPTIAKEERRSTPFPPGGTQSQSPCGFCWEHYVVPARRAKR